MSLLLTDLLRLSGKAFPGVSKSVLVLRAKFVSAGLRQPDLVRQVIHAAQGTEMRRMFEEAPEVLGALIWPYQCAFWEAEERLRRIIGHYAATDQLGPPYRFSTTERLELAHLETIRPGLYLVLDQPHWFRREGGLVLNVFIDNFRAFSLAFSLFRDPDGQLCATIGGLQGRNREDALDIYRDLTKAAHGLRPRDLLIEVFRILCGQIGIARVQAVADAARYSHHPYFKGKSISQNYDEVWQDRGGQRSHEWFYDIPVARENRDLATVKPNKRSMYRQRFEFLDGLEADLIARLAVVHPVPAPQAE